MSREIGMSGVADKRNAREGQVKAVDFKKPQHLGFPRGPPPWY